MTFEVIADNGNSRTVESRAEAEDVKKDMEGLGMSVEINQVKETDGGNTHTVAAEKLSEETEEPKETFEAEDKEIPEVDELESAGEFGNELERLAPDGRNLSDDPLDILPGYMITEVDGKPSLNKRGVSVLAYQYDITVTDREVVTYPHENGYETAVVKFMVEGPDGRTFSGIGEAHVDETPKHQLLRMAETRAYKRSVIFATGTGIVGYQELMEEL